jgi:hypothetical protein
MFSGLLRCVINSFPTFRRNVPPLFTGLWAPKLADSRENEGGMLFFPKLWEEITQPRGSTIEKTWSLNCHAVDT